LTEPTHPSPSSPDELGFESIVYEKAPPRATITLNRPEVLNAFDFRMLRELARACEDASWDDEIRVVVLTGAGRAFCVGADLKEWSRDYLGKRYSFQQHLKDGQRPWKLRPLQGGRSETDLAPDELIRTVINEPARARLSAGCHTWATSVRRPDRRPALARAAGDYLYARFAAA
jgi:hypothetical protein